MGLLDFIFGKKKDAKTSVPQSKPAAKPQPTASRPATTTSSAPKTAKLSIAPFVFESNQHQRYEMVIQYKACKNVLVQLRLKRMSMVAVVIN